MSVAQIFTYLFLTLNTFIIIIKFVFCLEAEPNLSQDFNTENQLVVKLELKKLFHIH